MIQKILHDYFMASGSRFHQRSESIYGLPATSRLQSDDEQRKLSGAEACLLPTKPQ